MHGPCMPHAPLAQPHDIVMACFHGTLAGCKQGGLPSLASHIPLAARETNKLTHIDPSDTRCARWAAVKGL